MIILVYTALHKAFVFYEVLYHTRFFSQFVVARIHFVDDGILLVYYIAKYIVFNYFHFRLPGRAIATSCSSGLR